MKRRTFLTLGSGAALGALALGLPQATAAERRPGFLPLPEIDASKPPDPNAFGQFGSATGNSEGKPADNLPAGSRILLPTPSRFGGGTLLQALSERRSTRQFSSRPIPENTLSDLLWSTWGVNRPDGRRTAPTPNNNQNADLYVALASGIWLYNAARNQLDLKARQDIRQETGPAPLILLFAAPDDTTGAMTVGSLYQNTGLYCASVGLGNVVRGSKLGAARKVLPISEEYKIWVSQSVGWLS